MWWSIYNWTLENIFLVSKNIFGGPTNGISSIPDPKCICQSRQPSTKMYYCLYSNGTKKINACLYTFRNPTWFTWTADFGAWYKWGLVQMSSVYMSLVQMGWLTWDWWNQVVQAKRSRPMEQQHQNKRRRKVYILSEEALSKVIPPRLHLQHKKAQGWPSWSRTTTR